MKRVFALIGAIIVANLAAMAILLFGLTIFNAINLYHQSGNIAVAAFGSLMATLLQLLFAFSSQCGSYGACLPVPWVMLGVTAAVIIWFFGRAPLDTNTKDADPAT